MSMTATCQKSLCRRVLNWWRLLLLPTRLTTPDNKKVLGVGVIWLRDLARPTKLSAVCKLADWCWSYMDRARNKVIVLNHCLSETVVPLALQWMSILVIGIISSPLCSISWIIGQQDQIGWTAARITQNISSVSHMCEQLSDNSHTERINDDQCMTNTLC